MRHIFIAQERQVQTKPYVHPLYNWALEQLQGSTWTKESRIQVLVHLGYIYYLLFQFPSWDCCGNWRDLVHLVIYLFICWPLECPLAKTLCSIISKLLKIQNAQNRITRSHSCSSPKEGHLRYRSQTDSPVGLKVFPKSFLKQREPLWLLGRTIGLFQQWFSF